MIFTTYEYILFLFIVFVLHWTVPEKWRKELLIVASYVFYCTWDWRFGFLLLGLSLFNWAYANRVLSRNYSTGAIAAGVAVNLGALVYFKYTKFILVNAADVAQLFGSTWQPSFGDIILPLGLSFFTFQGIAYLVDVAGGEEPLHSLRDFLLFKALWPQLVAGPIIRLSEIREQIEGTRTLDYPDVAEGSRRIVFGFFKKWVLADNLAPYVDSIFGAATPPHFADAVVGAIGFGLQIYFDFSAYSDIAIGTARLFGFRFPENFNWPYAAVSPQDFWNRWHMTLSRWIRDYLYTPYAFALRRRPRLAPTGLLVAMALCGLWHGAQWTFVLWGVWHGLLLLLNQSPIGRRFFVAPDRRASVSMFHRVAASAVTLILVFAGWIFFRATSIHQAMVFFRTILTFHGGLHPALIRENVVLFVGAMFAAVLSAQLLRGFLSRRPDFARRVIPAPGLLRPLAYALIIIAIIVFEPSSRAFIYFQF
ncbi:MAG TPA: MBOAT family O-acyltransferase [Gemmatimonadaceae bacterium]|nr:MBOAT family O-acyltransferase [Gemmatimonadaceae bacterium]